MSKARKRRSAARHHLQVTPAEFHTLLAALRYYQSKLQTEPDCRTRWIDDIATNLGEIEALDDSGIDRLCERINTDGLS